MSALAAALIATAQTRLASGRRSSTGYSLSSSGPGYHGLAVLDRVCGGAGRMVSTLAAEILPDV